MQLIIFRIKSLIVEAFFTSEGTAFHITGLEYNRLSLSKRVLGIGIVKVLFETDRNESNVHVAMDYVDVPMDHVPHFQTLCGTYIPISY